MRVQQVNTYKYDELTKDAQAKVLEHARDINVDYDDWCEGILDDFKATLEGLGYEDSKIEYTGFWSQGDGASFTATVNLETWLKAHKLGNKYKLLLAKNEGVDATIYRTSHHYSHENTIAGSISVNSYDGNDKLDAQCSEVEELLTDEARTLSKELYRTLASAYDAETSDEAVIDTLLANDYDYTENGKLF